MLGTLALFRLPSLQSSDTYPVFKPCWAHLGHDGQKQSKTFFLLLDFLGESKSSYKVFGKDALASLDWSGEASWALQEQS